MDAPESISKKTLVKYTLVCWGVALLVILGKDAGESLGARLFQLMH